MQRVDYERDFDSGSWDPPDGNTFPLPTTQRLRVNARGWYNRADTLAMGYGFRMAPAYKPSLQVTLVSADPTIPMIFGAIWPNGAPTDPFADNVGVTPVVLQALAGPRIQFLFTMTFESLAAP